ncbi:hypothetical protein OKW42_006739 [Paraburkholderia sp. WC7.3d]
MKTNTRRRGTGESPYTAWNVNAAIAYLDRVLFSATAHALVGQSYWRSRVVQVGSTPGFMHTQRIRLQRLRDLLDNASKTPSRCIVGKAAPPSDRRWLGSGNGAVHGKQKAFPDENHRERVNGLFEGGLADDDQLANANGILKGKLLENRTLVQQAVSNSKERFAKPRDLKDALLHTVIDWLDGPHHHQHAGAEVGAGAPGTRRRRAVPSGKTPRWIGQRFAPGGPRPPKAQCATGGRGIACGPLPSPNRSARLKFGSLRISYLKVTASRDATGRLPSTNRERTQLNNKETPPGRLAGWTALLRRASRCARATPMRPLAG